MILLHRCKFPYLLRRNTSDVIRAFASMDSRSASIQQPEELRIIPDVDAVFKRKRILRSKVRKILKAMDPEIRAQQDKEIRDVVVGAPWFKSCTGLCAYISCSALREVDTSAILAEILQNGAAVQDSHGHTRKKLYVPRIEDKNSHMRMLHITGVDDLVANSMDILEPALVDAKGSQCEDGLAFDRTGRRLGRGGGYYDTFLLSYQKLARERHWEQPLLVALSYTAQILEEGEIAVTPP